MNARQQDETIYEYHSIYMYMYLYCLTCVIYVEIIPWILNACKRYMKKHKIVKLCIRRPLLSIKYIWNLCPCYCYVTFFFFLLELIKLTYANFNSKILGSKDLVVNCAHKKLANKRNYFIHFYTITMFKGL